MTSKNTIEFGLVRVFGSDEALGNATGVVRSERPLESDECRRIATRLAVPDTVFLCPDESPARYRARTFSPTEELSLCVQGVLAAATFVRARGEVSRQGNISIAVASQRLIVSSKIEREGDVEEVQFERYALKAEDPVAELDNLVAATGTRPDRMIEWGRARVFREVESASVLAACDPTPSRVLAFCRRAGVSGVCIVHRLSPDRVAMRVFTTSLDGREDSATGGAAACIAHFLDPEGTTLPSRVTIEQGYGCPSSRRGRLYLGLPDRRHITIGGLTDFVAHGRLRGIGAPSERSTSESTR